MLLLWSICSYDKEIRHLWKSPTVADLRYQTFVYTALCYGIVVYYYNLQLAFYNTTNQYIGEKVIVNKSTPFLTTNLTFWR